MKSLSFLIAYPPHVAANHLQESVINTDHYAPSYMLHYLPQVPSQALFIKRDSFRIPRQRACWFFYYVSQITWQFLCLKVTKANTDGIIKKLVTVFAEPHLDRSVMRDRLNTLENFIKVSPTPTSRRAPQANTAPYSPSTVTVSRLKNLDLPGASSSNASLIIPPCR